MKTSKVSLEWLNRTIVRGVGWGALFVCALSCAVRPAAAAGSEPAGRGIALQEATFDSIQRAILARKVTCEEVIRAYFERIEAYSGVCVAYPKPDLVAPSGKEIQLGPVTPIPNAGQVNAYANLNLRGQRSETDLVDQDPNKPDAIETARKLDAHFAKTGKLVGPLHCTAAAIKDQFDTFDLRTTDGSYTDFADDRPPKDSAVVARLRAAGAIIIGKANMGEYASAPRSTYGGQVCNPYATDREPGASSSGSAVAVAANLASFAIAEESLGSVLDPAKKNGVVGIVPTYGFISRDGMWRANLFRERVGTHTRTVLDAARLLDVLVGYDSSDPVTAVTLGNVPREGYAKHAVAKSLNGKRIGVISEFMVAFTDADRDSVRVAKQAIAELRQAGAEVFESVNVRDLELFGAVDDPNIPNLSPSIQDTIAELLPTLEPGLDKIPTGGKNYTWPRGDSPIQAALDIHFDRTLFPAEINIRALNATPGGEFNEGKFALNRYLRNRGDANIKDLVDLTTKTIARYKDKKAPSFEGATLDAPGQAAHLFRRQAIQGVLLKVMADNRLDAFVFPHATVPPGVIGETAEPDVQNRPARGYNAITDVSGLPAIVVPAGFTNEVYDRDKNAPERYLPVKSVSLPVGLTFLGRPYSEATLLSLASAYEHATSHRKPPPGFGELPAKRALAAP